MTDAERVLVAPTRLLHELGYFQGFCDQPERYLPALLDPRHLRYEPRDRMECDPSFKQLIPYVVFRCRGAGGEPQLFRYVRGSGQGEARLRAKISIGVGGHISSVDGQAGSVAYEEGMRRELAEEVEVRSTYRSRCLGLINDDLTEVGQVHLGIVHLWELEEPEVVPREADILEAGFQPIEALRAQRERLESWSQICLDALEGPE